MEEALVNAAYHRSYEGNLEPIKVYLYPDRMEIISYPGPVPGIEMRHFEGAGSVVPPVPNRSQDRRVSEGSAVGGGERHWHSKDLPQDDRQWLARPEHLSSNNQEAPFTTLSCQHILNMW